MKNNFDYKPSKKKKDNTIKSQRQLKVGEELRHLISNALHRETFYDQILEVNNITITEVDVSSDLKNAKVYVMPLGGKQKLEVIESLNKVKNHIKKLISSLSFEASLSKISIKVLPMTFLFCSGSDTPFRCL